MSPAAQTLPPGALLSWYGDDFTGATAVMEVLSFAGLPAVLFLDVPSDEQMRAFAGYRAIGIAGSARSQSPEWMEANLPDCFGALASVGAPIAHYKVCSTFDSSPHVGSIGRAVELAAPVLGGAWHPLIIAAPEIARYQAFGNLFASVDGTPYRLDRHPVMSRHPVTPMDEADVCRHLARQTSLPIGLVNIVELMSRTGAAALLEAQSEEAQIVALDVIDDASLAEAGRLIWENRGERLFAVGSQGIEYALVAYWRSEGLIPSEPEQVRAGAVDDLAIVSGSCSPITARQIEWANQHGFDPIQIDAACAVDDHAWDGEQSRAVAAALDAIGKGAVPIVFTASGPDDPAVARFSAAVSTAGKAASEINARVGRGLGSVLAKIVSQAKLSRGVIAGGDTSSHASAGLGLHALTALAPIAPGAPLCRGHSDDPNVDGFQIALKGGQMGPPDYFNLVKQGG